MGDVGVQELVSEKAERFRPIEEHERVEEILRKTARDHRHKHRHVKADQHQVRPRRTAGQRVDAIWNEHAAAYSSGSAWIVLTISPRNSEPSALFRSYLIDICMTGFSPGISRNTDRSSVPMA